MTFDFFSERREVVTAPYNSFVLEDGVITRYQKRKITKVANYDECPISPASLG